MTNSEVKAMLVAMEAGARYGADVIVGNVFLGAYGAADAAGYLAPRNGERNHLRSIFVTGYLQNLKVRGVTGVTVDGTGTITHI